MAGLIDVIAVERVDFVSVPTRDLARARRFYGEVLGLPASRTNPDEFEAANVTLTLWQPEAQNLPFSPDAAGIALRVADVNVAREQLVAKGVRFLGDTVDTGVCLMGFFYDPDGKRAHPPSPVRASGRLKEEGCALPPENQQGHVEQQCQVSTARACADGPLRFEPNAWLRTAPTA